MKRRYVAAFLAAATMATTVGTSLTGASAARVSAVNRTNPFMPSANKFCVKKGNVATAALKANPGMGYTESTITIGHLRSDLDKLVPFGIYVDHGNMVETTRVFTDIINNVCGGIRGRKLTVIDKGYHPAVATQRDSVAQQLWDDYKPAAAYTTSGWTGPGVQFLVKDVKVPLVTGEGGSLSLMRTGNYFSFGSYPAEVGVNALMDSLGNMKALKSTDIVGVVSPETDGIAAGVQPLITARLKKLGIKPQNIHFAQITCTGKATGQCAGKPELAAKFKAAGMDATNGVYIPIGVGSSEILPVMEAMASAGVDFRVSYSTGLANAAGDTQANTMCSKGATSAGCLGFLKTRFLDWTFAGPHRTLTKLDPFTQMCVDEYNKGYGLTANGAATVLANNPVRIGMIGSVCAALRIIAAGIWAAGDNPKRADISKGIRTLGDIDFRFALPATTRPGKPWFAKDMFWQKGQAPCPPTNGVNDLVGVPGKQTVASACLFLDAEMNKIKGAKVSIDYQLKDLQKG